MAQEVDLRERFGDLVPISSAPVLFRVNGCGLGLYGARDFDQETNTYVKTWCVSFLWVPVFALRAYRVAKGENGWAILGRQPLSGFVRLWNQALGSGILGLIVVGSWYGHFHSEEYLAAKKLENAETHLAAGEVGQAAALYGELVSSHSSEERAARLGFERLVSGGLTDASASVCREVVAVAVEARRSTGLSVGGEALHRACMSAASRAAAVDPEGALALIEDASALEVAAQDREEESELLRTIARALPEDPRPASSLAELLESEGELDACESLLAPHSGRLQDLEGARILGQICASSGRLDEAEALLAPYVAPRLAALHTAERALEAAVAFSQDDAIAALNQDTEFRRRWEQAADAKREAMVDERVGAYIRSDREVARARDQLIRASAVVPVALNLGLLQVARARALDSEGRRAELEKAEGTFRAIQVQAGESEQFQLGLAQVDYWLGKHEEGRAVIDRLLESNHRDPELLLEAGSLLRIVGSEEEARAMAEEALEGAADPQVREGAAMLRALLEADLDERITWLRRCTGMPEGQLLMERTLGEKAMEEGHRDEAASHFRKVLAAYESLPELSSTLNNASGLHMELFAITRNPADLERGIAAIEKAIALEPTNSIVLSNGAGTLVGAALQELVADKLDLQALKTTARWDHLPFLYEDGQGRDAVASRLGSHPAFCKAVGYLERSASLAPKARSAYEALLTLASKAHDGARLRDLEERLAGVQLDFSDHEREMRDFLSGSRDGLPAARAELARLESVLEGVRPLGGKPLGVAAAELVTQHLALDCFGEECDADELVELAESAVADSPSEGARMALAHALAFRVLTTLASGEPRLEAWRVRARLCLSPSYALALVLGRDVPVEGLRLDEPDIQRFLALERDFLARFPERVEPYYWALFRSVDPDLAATCALRIEENESGRAQRRIERRLSPLTAMYCLDAYWQSKMQGKDDEARSVLEELAARGGPRPLDLE